MAMIAKYIFLMSVVYVLNANEARSLQNKDKICLRKRRKTISK